MTLTELFVSIANAIRAKTGETAAIKAEDFPAAIEAIQTGGGGGGEVGNKRAVLEVEKIVSKTYAGETAYTDEEFILFDIYPKTNGTATVTYGGLTKTVTDTSGAEEPNAQQVFFGTFNGISDEVETPASGLLTIEGDYYAYGISSFKLDKAGGAKRCTCVKRIAYFGSASVIPNRAFAGCDLTLTELPEGIKSIGDYAFQDCTNVTVSVIPEGVETIGAYSFNFAESPFAERITLYLPSTIKSIGNYAFSHATAENTTAHYTYCDWIYVYATEPPALGDNSFGTGVPDGSYHSTKIRVPKGCVSAYVADTKWVTEGMIMNNAGGMD